MNSGKRIDTVQQQWLFTEQVIVSFPISSDSIIKISFFFVAVWDAEDRIDSPVPAYSRFPTKSRDFILARTQLILQGMAAQHNCVRAFMLETELILSTQMRWIQMR